MRRARWKKVADLEPLDVITAASAPELEPPGAVGFDPATEFDLNPERAPLPDGDLVVRKVEPGVDGISKVWIVGQPEPEYIYESFDGHESWIAVAVYDPETASRLTREAVKVGAH